jgi:serine/threonine protein kinase
MLREGSIVNERYQVIDLLGEGGLAQVWRVRHVDLGSEHALKVLIFRRARLAERLLLEGRIQAQLKHPNIVTVTDVVRFDGQVGLLMEYIDGVSLDAYLTRRGQLELEQGLELFASVLAGVRAAHLAGVLHRDLKPANILLARGPRGIVPKVADFGIAKVLEAETDLHATRVGAMMGTPGYLAPEQASDASTVDQRADIFALGAILYEALSGARAFPYAEPGAPETMIAEPLATVRGDLPEAIVQAVHRAMSVNASDRYPSIDAFAADLFADRPALLQHVIGTDVSMPLALALSLPSASPSSPPPVGETLAPLPADATQAAEVPAPKTVDETSSWTRFAVVALAALLLVAAWIGMREPGPVAPIEPAVQAPAEVAPPPQPLAEPLPVPAPTPATPAATPAPATPGAARTPAVASPSTPVAAPTPTPTGALPAPVPAAPAPAGDDAVAVIEPSPRAATPAPARAATPTPAAPSVPSVRGVWSGDAEGKPIRLRILEQTGSTVRAEFIFLLGPTQRSHIMLGTVTADGTLNLQESEGTLMVQARLRDGAATGTYQRGTTGRPLAWTASWTSR